MNWIFVIVLVIFGIFMIRGWHRGLLRILFSLIAVIALIGLVSWATPQVCDYLKTNTKIYTRVEQRCEEKLQQQIEEKLDDTAEDSAWSDSLPQSVVKYITSEGESAMEESGIYESAGSQMADWVIRAAAFLIALILAVILLSIIGRITKLANKIPIIKGINRTLGLFAGILQAYILISVLFLFVSLISGSDLGQKCIGQIDDNPFLTVLYYRNLLATFLLH